MEENPNADFRLAVLIPIFNEEKNIRPIYQAIRDALKNISNCKYNIVFVDDGSKDGSLAEIKQLQNHHSNISFLSFSRNFGKDAALMAGFHHISVNFDAVITIDSDLQHPPEMIPQLIANWQKGYNIVNTFREDKNHQASLLSQLASKLFYRIISGITDVKLENGLSDFKLIDKKVLIVIKGMKEEDPFLRGIFKWIGFNQISLPYTTGSRINGESKYSLKSLLSLALHSITSFTTKPLTYAIYIGFITSFFSFLYLPYVLYSVYEGYAVSGWASILATVAFLGGIQLIVMGIIGLYLGKVFMQSKQRPQYLVNEYVLPSNYPEIISIEKNASNRPLNL